MVFQEISTTRDLLDKEFNDFDCLGSEEEHVKFIVKLIKVNLYPTRRDKFNENLHSFNIDNDRKVN